jgi:tetratricopeptide (TPR) repeat protein
MKTKNANLEMKNAKCKILTFAICSLQFVFVLSGCVSFQAGGEIQHGRTALMFGDPNVALAHFQRAAEISPDYRYDFSILSQGVWTYVGRAYYAAGKFSEARNVLERARSRYADDYLAQLYLGLVLGRDGDRQRGLKEIGGALTGLGDWFDHLDRYHPEAPYWDPGRQIRAEIQKNLAMTSGKDIQWSQLIANGEWLGKAMEEEIDLSERQRRFEETRDGDDRDGNQP